MVEHDLKELTRTLGDNGDFPRRYAIAGFRRQPHKTVYNQVPILVCFTEDCAVENQSPTHTHTKIMGSAITISDPNKPRCCRAYPEGNPRFGKR